MGDSERSKALRQARSRAMLRLRIEFEGRYEALYAEELLNAGLDQRAHPQSYRARPDRQQKP